MKIVSTGDNLHEISTPVSWEEKNLKILSAENFTQGAKRYGELINFQGRQVCHNCFCSLVKKGLLKKERICFPLGTFFFPFRIDPFSEADW